MNSFKTLVVVCVLGAAGYWMYINMGQKTGSEPQAGVSAAAQALAAPPSVQIPGLYPSDPQSAGVVPAGITSNGASSPAPVLLGGGSAPAFSANSAPISGSASAAVYPAAQNSNPSVVSPALSVAALPENNLQNKFDSLMETARKKLDEGRLAEVQLSLSALYDDPELPAAQAKQLTELLDQLAGTVIYSRQHLLEPPYIVQPGDTLERIGEKYNVPGLLIARINGLGELQPLRPGRELKVVRGPFSALIHLEKHELTLMVGGRYAGRFAIGVGCDQPRLEGEYVVREKNINPQYRGPGGTTVAGGDPHNPLGKFWIGLGENVGLHGTVDPQNIGRDDNRGTICLGDRDIEDLYGILSIGSRVVIQR
jgi:hypothetical protein